MTIADAYFAGEKRPEVTAANPEYKIGDIGKVPHLPIQLQNAMKTSVGSWSNVEGA